METNIQKWGNSLGVRLPKSITDTHALRAGSRVVVTETKTGLAIHLVKKKKRSLHEMLRGITEESLHGEHDWGKSVGNEVW